MRRYDNKDLKKLLDKFRDHLVCWQVGLSFGSFMYFNMGGKLTEKMKDGSDVEIGSAIFELESDIWVIWEEYTGKRSIIATSDIITQNLVGALVSKCFEGKSLNSIRYIKSSKECVANFSKSDNIYSNVRIHMRAASEEDLCTFTLPDGTIIFCSAQEGFLSDDSRSDVHAIAYASR